MSLACLIGVTWVFRVKADERSQRGFFAGGSSDISSDDPARAGKAIAKWSDPEAWTGEAPASEAPYFWDYEVVGRPVFLRVIKNSSRTGVIEVWLEDPDTRHFEFFKAYRIAYFSGDPGPKIKQGDNQAPEGFYCIGRSGLNPISSYHLSMDIGYPNAFDRHHGRTGDWLMIHGKAVSIGCFAMTDTSIEQLYTLVETALTSGQKFVRVHCFPFPMTEEHLKQEVDSPHYGFWSDLKRGWDWFEREGRPPNVEVKDGRYVFSKFP